MWTPLQEWEEVYYNSSLQQNLNSRVCAKYLKKRYMSNQFVYTVPWLKNGKNMLEIEINCSIHVNKEIFSKLKNVPTLSGAAGH